MSAYNVKQKNIQLTHLFPQGFQYTSAKFLLHSRILIENKMLKLCMEYKMKSQLALSLHGHIALVPLRKCFPDCVLSFCCTFRLSIIKHKLEMFLIKFLILHFLNQLKKVFRNFSFYPLQCTRAVMVRSPQFTRWWVAT